MSKEHIYLDNAADTRICEAALAKMNECMADGVRNASSLHFCGRRAAAYLEEARDVIAASVGAAAHEIIFTGGGTEADNIAVIGTALANSGRGRHIVSTAVEHPAVLNSLAYLQSLGCEVTLLGCDENCFIDIDQLRGALRDDTALVSVMHVNNETGAINDIAAAAAAAHEAGALFMSDCVQSYTKLPVNVNEMGIDLLTASAHKFHGPHGVGFLYVRNGVKINQVSFGGGQERALRPGTQNVPAVAAMAAAVKEAAAVSGPQRQAEALLRDRLEARLSAENPGAVVNCASAREKRIYDNLNVSFAGVTADAMLYALDDAGLCVSAGSACEAGSLEISHVIKAIGAEERGAPIRFSLSRYTRAAEIELAADIVRRVYARLTSRA